MLIELVDGFWVDPELVAVVRTTGDGECALFTAGQPATDGGFHLNYEATQICEEINRELGEFDEPEPGEGKDEGEASGS